MFKKNLLAIGVALTMVSHSNAATVLAADVVAANTFNWSTGVDELYHTADDANNQWGQIGLTNSGSAAVTAEFPRSGDGSLKLASNDGTNAKAGVAYYPPTVAGFGTLASISAASFDWMRATGSNAADGSPVMRLFLFTPDTDTHVATLLWTASNDGVTVTDNQWVSTNVMEGKVWNAKTIPAGSSLTPIPSPGKLFSDVQGQADYKDLVVRAVEIGFGSGGWSPTYVGAADNVVFTGDKASVTSNFEMAPPNFDVTVTAGANGSVSPSGVQAVAEASTLAVTVTPDADYLIDTVTGCGGTLADNVYTTAPVTEACAVDVTFAAKPVTPAVPEAAAPQSVPTLGQWAIAILGSLMAGFAALRLRARK